jgi:hypothetical protein
MDVWQVPVHSLQASWSSVQPWCGDGSVSACGVVRTGPCDGSVGCVSGMGMAGGPSVLVLVSVMVVSSHGWMRPMGSMSVRLVCDAAMELM